MLQNFFFLIGLLGIFLCINGSNSNLVKTVIVHMPGNNDSGLNFLSYKKFNRRECFSEELNPNHNYVQSIDLTKDTSVLIYSNNLPTQLMDLGGVNCVQFYTNMVIDACEKYPKSDILLAGA